MSVAGELGYQAASFMLEARKNDHHKGGGGGGSPSKPADFVFYHYTPSVVAAVIFIALFGGSTLTHSYQVLRTRTWFMIPFIVGGGLEILGYVGRILSANQAPDFTLVPYIIQSIALLVAPPLFAASIYMELARIVLMVDGDHALFIRREKLTKIFVCGDIACFFIQATGGGMQATKNADIGEYVVIGGLILQLVFFGLFVMAGALFHIRMNQNPTPKCSNYPWAKHLFSMYTVSILIFVRCLVRVIEFAQGYNGYILSHEVFLYTLDAAPMWLAMFTMNVIHPSEVGALIRGSGRYMVKIIFTKNVYGSGTKNFEMGSQTNVV